MGKVPVLVLVGSCCLRIRLQTPVVLLWGALPDRPRSPRRTSPRRPVLTTSGPTSECPERGEELPEACPLAEQVLDECSVKPG